MIREAPLLRECFERQRHSQRVFIVSGRPECWEAAASMLRQVGCSIVAYHQVVKGRHKAPTPDVRVLHGRIGSEHADADVLFAGEPRKSLFAASPPAPQRCLWHVPPPKWQRTGIYLPAFGVDHHAALRELFESLADDDSRAVLASLVRARIEGETGYHRISGFAEYDHPVARPNPGDVVIDAGAFEGDSAVLYAKRVGSSGRVIALEPSASNHERLLERLRGSGLQQITPVKLGVYDADALLRFTEGKGASSKLDPEGGGEIKVMPIDKIVRDLQLRRVDVIKLDVEGAERNALDGARDTIRRHRPVLHLSIYHKPNDLFEIPALVRSWLPRYRYYLGHHSYYQTETDLYAVPLERWVRRTIKRRLRLNGAKLRVLEPGAVETAGRSGSQRKFNEEMPMTSAASSPTQLPPSEVRTPYFELVPEPGASELVVVFCPVNLKPGVWAMWKAMSGQGVHALFVNDKNNGWYQEGIEGLGTTVEETAASIRKQAAALKASTITTIGNSMGGYGALLYGAQLGCRSLAFGAETILRLPGSRSALMMPKAARARFPDLRELLSRSRSHATLCLGEADLIDLVSGKNVSDLPNVDIVSVRGVAHAAPDFLGDRFGFREVVSSYLKTGKLPEFPERGALCAKRDAVELVWQAQLASYRKDWAVAEALLSAALALAPACEVVHHRLGVVHHERGNLADALAHQSCAVQMTPHFGAAQHYLGLALRKFGELRAAAAAQRVAASVNPLHAPSFFQLGELEAELGNASAARIALAKAVELDGKNQLYAGRLKELAPG